MKPHKLILIENHTDYYIPEGNYSLIYSNNWQLSNERADEIYNYLLSKGINSDKAINDMKILSDTIKKLENDYRSLKRKVVRLEKISHEPRKFVTCQKCNNKIKEL